MLSGLLLGTVASQRCLGKLTCFSEEDREEWAPPQTETSKGRLPSPGRLSLRLCARVVVCVCVFPALLLLPCACLK